MKRLMSCIIVAGMFLVCISAARADLLSLLGMQADYTVETPEPDKGQAVRRLFFVGNSYTSYHFMPQMIPWIAQSVDGNTHHYEVVSHTPGASALSAHAGNAEVLQKIRTGKFSHIFLQEQSQMPFLPAAWPQSVAALKGLADAARAAGAVPFLVATWPRATGDRFYQTSLDGRSTPLANPAAALQYMNGFFSQAAQQAQCKIVPIGAYWVQAADALRGIALYQPDRSHPTIEGSYLNALLFYRYVSGVSPQKVTWAPKDMDKSVAARLRDFAAR